MKMLRAIWVLLRQSLLVQLVEIGGAAAIVYGLDIQVGRGAAWIAAGVAGVLKAFELDIDRPDSGTPER